jgi:Mce-associated membrane protein
MSTGEQPDQDRAVSDADVSDTDESEPDVTVEETVAAPEAPVPAAPGRRWRWAVVVPLALLAASVVACGSVYWFLFRPDQLTNDSVQQQVVAAAREGTEAVLSYSSDNLDASLADAKSHLTGEFLDHYSKFTDDVVRPAVTQKGVKTEAHVARAAVSEMHPGTAQVLVFVNQVTTSKDRPSPALATSTVIVTMVKSGGQWRISEFKPV